MPVPAALAPAAKPSRKTIPYPNPGNNPSRTEYTPLRLRRKDSATRAQSPSPPGKENLRERFQESRFIVNSRPESCPEMESLPQKLLENAVQELNRLPGIGRKTALRLALFLLAQEEGMVERFGNTLIDFRKNTRYCRLCHNISDTEVCPVCASPKRDRGTICVVSDVRDVMALENTGIYNGLYHVLGGLINPLSGISPSQLHIESLSERIKESAPEEIILALPATPEGDTTAFYISRKIKPFGVKITAISKGIAIGDDLEYTDEVTLGRSLANRTEYH